MDASDGGNLRQCVSSSGSDSGPAWSPDGSKIAYHSDQDGDTEIYLVNVNEARNSRVAAPCLKIYSALFRLVFKAQAPRKDLSRYSRCL